MLNCIGLWSAVKQFDHYVKRFPNNDDDDYNDNNNNNLTEIIVWITKLILVKLQCTKQYQLISEK